MMLYLMTSKDLQNYATHCENEVPSVPLRFNRDEKKTVRFVVPSFVIREFLDREKVHLTSKHIDRNKLLVYEKHSQLREPKTKYDSIPNEKLRSTK